jgi:hypothetical protein
MDGAAPILRLDLYGANIPWVFSTTGLYQPVANLIAEVSTQVCPRLSHRKAYAYDLLQVGIVTRRLGRWLTAIAL